MGRAPCCDKANVKRGPWSPEEDATLKRYVEAHGTGGNWIALPQKAGLKRCGKSCRLRWLNYLRPNIKHGGFTEEEDNIICSLYSQMGSRWSVIASHLAGRTDNDVKNYWNTKLKKKLLASLSTPTPTPSGPPLCVPKPEPFNDFDCSSQNINPATYTSYGELTNFDGPQTLSNLNPIDMPFSLPETGLASQFGASSSLQEVSETIGGNRDVEDGGIVMDFGFPFFHDLGNGLWSSTTQDQQFDGAASIFPC